MMVVVVVVVVVQRAWHFPVVEEGGPRAECHSDNGRYAAGVPCSAVTAATGRVDAICWG
jgi:hypothetical protein